MKRLLLILGSVVAVAGTAIVLAPHVTPHIAPYLAVFADIHPAHSEAAHKKPAAAPSPSTTGSSSGARAETPTRPRRPCGTTGSRSACSSIRPSSTRRRSDVDHRSEN